MYIQDVLAVPFLFVSPVALLLCFIRGIGLSLPVMRWAICTERGASGMKWVKIALATGLSAGWLVPLFLAVHFCLIWLNTQVAPRVFGLPPQDLGYAPLARADMAFWTGFIWLSVVVVIGSALLSYRYVGRDTRPGPPV